MVSATARGVDEEVEIELRGFTLPGHLTVPPSPRGVVVFVHDGASGTDERDRLVARGLCGAGLGALRFDLVDTHEGVDAAPVPAFDLDVLAVRLLVVTRWLRARRSTHGCRIGYFGVGTGAAVALLAAAEDPAIGAVVSRAGRLELVTSRVETIEVPTLLLVGNGANARDEAEQVSRALHGPRDIAVVPDAGELFMEPAALDAVAQLASAWFLRHLRSTTRGTETP